MAAIIDQPRPFLHLTLAQLNSFFEAWCQFNDLDEIKRQYSKPARDIATIVSAKELGENFDIVAELYADAKSRQNTWPRLAQEMTPEAFGEIDALIRFTRDKLEYSEDFERERNITIRDFLAATARGENEFRQSAFHLLKKRMALVHVLNTLRFFGHIDMVHAVIAQLGLEESAGQLLENSSRYVCRRYRTAADALGVDLRRPANERLPD
ncbi:hypothetical protein [Caballeronia sp. NCTM5]|uniref:hypothetical protein n=1 Tax=Caballeronia sp. NCTM5 TaxID=2921755 RepID=UPI0020290186|nr:hypothetical protein [Caballeronia sp. NCTM5]